MAGVFEPRQSRKPIGSGFFFLWTKGAGLGISPSPVFLGRKVLTVA